MPRSLNSEDFPGNSKASKREKPEKIVEGKVTKKNESLSRRIVENFSGDDAHSVLTYLILEVFVPGAKDMISDMVSEGVDRLLFGEHPGRRSRGSRRLGGGVLGDRTSYSNFFAGVDTPSSRREISRKAIKNHSIDEIILDDRGDAEMVIENLRGLIETYGIATVMDLYDLVGVSGDFTANNFGWTDLRSARVVRSREGFILDFPEAEPLEK